MTDPRQEWQTPPEFLEALRPEFDICLDVCASKENAVCADWIGVTTDALGDEVEWYPDDGRGLDVWCNPGFAHPDPWIKKSYKQANEYRITVLYMGRCAPSTEWWNEWGVKAAEIRLLSPRVNFIPAPGIKKSSNNQECALFVFRPRPDNAPPAHIWTWRWRGD